MSQRREFEIAFVGLKPGLHHYEYRVDDKFFASFGPQDFSHCEANIRLTLDKKTGFMQLKFDIDGTVQGICDKCGNSLPLQLWDEFSLLVKLVDDPDTMNEQEEDPDVFYIGRGESHLYLSNWIYEFIILSIPFQKICADAEKGGPYCNLEVLEKLKQLEQGVKSENKTIWKGLDQFKDLTDNN
jgi:uncharacterized metal-binding protein YceD (DUF177 family)